VLETSYSSKLDSIFTAEFSCFKLIKRITVYLVYHDHVVIRRYGFLSFFFLIFFVAFYCIHFLKRVRFVISFLYIHRMG